MRNFSISKEGKNADELFMLVSELGAEDFIEEEDNFVIYTMPEDLTQIQ